MIWFLVCDQRSSVGLCTQDYKSIRSVVTSMTCARVDRFVPPWLTHMTHRQIVNGEAELRMYKMPNTSDAV